MKIPRFILLTVFSICVFGAAYTAPLGKRHGLTPVRNFSRLDYDAGAQNWCAVQDSLGRMYFGNQYGLLSFDGRRWDLQYLPNYSSVRSLLLDYPSGRLYAGGSNELGYFSSDSISGNTSFTSLVGSLPAADRNFSEIWNIFEIDGKIWFQGDFSLFRYDGKSTVTFPFEERIARSALIRGRLYVALQNGKLVRFNGLRAEDLPGTDILRDKKITALLPWHDKRSLLIATSVDGLYIYTDGKTSPLTTKIDDFLRRNQIFNAEKSGDEYIFGTVNDGVIVLNSVTGAVSHINRENGMQNNTVLATMTDYTGNIWLMLDNGIDYALHISPIRNLTGRFDEYGAGYASMMHRGTLYLGTNQGLYRRNRVDSDAFDNTSPVARYTQILKGQIWSIDTIGASASVPPTLFAAGDAGVFYDTGSGFRQIEGVEGCYRIVPLKGRSGEALASTYSQFHRLKYENGVWKDAGKLNGYDDIGGNFFQAPDGRIWISHWRKGVFRLTLAQDASSFVKVELLDRHAGLPTDNNNSAALLGNDVVISTEGGFFRFDPKTRRLKTDRQLNDIFGYRLPGHLHVMPDQQLIKVNRAEFIVAHKDFNGETKVDSSSFRSIADRMIPGFEHLDYVSPHEVIVSGQDGFWSIDLNPDSHPLPAKGTFIASVMTKNDSVIYRPHIGPEEMSPLKVPYDCNSLKFEFACPDYSSGNAVMFSSMLENYDKEWSPWSQEDVREYTRLSEGVYTLKVRTRHLATGEIEETAFRFRIQPPWYRSPWAYVIYILVVAGAGLTIWRWAKHWKAEAEKEAEEKKERELRDFIRQSEQDALVKDHQIAVLKSEQLEHDIRHKSQELGNTTMNLIRKNEILNAIAAKISKIQEMPEVAQSQSDIRKHLGKIQTQIKENISHDDDWKNFTENFDIVYHDYTKRLHETHPELSPSDLRICCYIKMGLSSKEIAPLISISYKSVEMSRYRLRKKMNLDRDTSLTEYLQNF